MGLRFTMKLLLWPVMLAFACGLRTAQAQTVVRDKFVTSVLTDGLIAESHKALVGEVPPSHVDNAGRGVLLVRLFLLGERGECAEPSPKQCPKVKLLVAVKDLLEVEFPGVPSARLYQLDDAYGWELTRWKSFSSNAVDRNSFTVFEVRKRVIRKVPDKSKFEWKDELYEISANTFRLRVAKMN